jgi:hypothetical protein
VKAEIDRAVGVHGGELVSVGIGLGSFGIAGVRCKNVTNRAGSADDPSGKNAALAAPVIGVVNPLHEEVGVAVEDVDILRMELEEIAVGAASAGFGLGRIAHAVPRAMLSGRASCIPTTTVAMASAANACSSQVS